MKIKGCLKTLLVFAAGYAAGSIVMKLIDNRTMEQKIQDAVEEELAKLELNKKEIDCRLNSLFLLDIYSLSCLQAELTTNDL